jgi:hypothetical protein
MSRRIVKKMSFEESIHLLLHSIQIVASLAIIALFWRNYVEIKSKFNLGLVVFAVSVLGQIIFSLSLPKKGERTRRIKLISVVLLSLSQYLGFAVVCYVLEPRL